MNQDLLDILSCPDCSGDLAVDGGSLRCTKCPGVFPIVNGIPRFVPVENYAASFGMQWNRFPQTQLDSHTGLSITRDRFFAQSGWSAGDLSGKRVLDVGCGSGRFAEIALSAGARLVAVDYSAAVEAARANVGDGPNVDVVQADVFHLPFKRESFDFVYCFGVLQHTPDPALAFRSILPPLRRGGSVAVDVYPKSWMSPLWPKYWLRPVTKRLSRERLFRIVETMVPLLLPISRLLGRIPIVGRKLRWFVPVVNYEGIHPLNERQIREWAVLDTFDMLSPAHDHPQTRATLRSWIEAVGLRDGEVVKTGHLVARGVKG